jgi:hypothetical protein
MLNRSEQVLDFLSDVMITLKAFFTAYPPAAKVFVSSENTMYVQNYLLCLWQVSIGSFYVASSSGSIDQGS